MAPKKVLTDDEMWKIIKCYQTDGQKYCYK